MTLSEKTFFLGWLILALGLSLVWSWKGLGAALILIGAMVFFGSLIRAAEEQRAQRLKSASEELNELLATRFRKGREEAQHESPRREVH